MRMRGFQGGGRDGESFPRGQVDEAREGAREGSRCGRQRWMVRGRYACGYVAEGEAVCPAATAAGHLLLSIPTARRRAVSLCDPESGVIDEWRPDSKGALTQVVA